MLFSLFLKFFCYLAGAFGINVSDPIDIAELVILQPQRLNNRLSNCWLKLCSEAKRSQLLRVLVDFLVSYLSFPEPAY
jgi:hypothetical protein